MRWLTDSKIVLAMGAACVALLLDATVAYRATRALIDANARVTQSFEVLIELKATLSTVTDAEIGQRGYLITGEPAYLEPYEAALARIDGHLARLKERTADHPLQHRRSALLAEHIAKRLASLNRGLALNRAQGVAAARAGGGAEAMPRIQAIIEEMENEERASLARHAQESGQSGRQAVIGLAVGTSLSLALVGFAYYLVRHYLRISEQAAQSLQAEHDDLERRVQERTRELERSNRELQDFAFIASHDLQEPLRKIQTFGDRLNTTYGQGLEPQVRDYLERIQNAARRMQTLIGDILAFSRVTSKAQPFIPVALEEVTREVVGDLEGRIEQTGGRVEIGTLPALEADPLQMRQLMQNLIGNALKFHRHEVPPRVEVRGAIIENDAASETLPGNAFCEIAVIDNGIGIDEQTPASDPIGSQHAEERWARRAQRDQERCRAAAHPGGGLNDFQGRRRHPSQL